MNGMGLAFALSVANLSVQLNFWARFMHLNSDTRLDNILGLAPISWKRIASYLQCRARQQAESTKAQRAKRQTERPLNNSRRYRYRDAGKAQLFREQETKLSQIVDKRP